METKTTFRLISNIANNINQIALRVNSTGNICAEDISELKKDIDELWRQQRYFQSELQKLHLFEISLNVVFVSIEVKNDSIQLNLS